MTGGTPGRAKRWAVAVAAVWGTVGCGPVADVEPEIELEQWLFGIWSSALMTSDQMSSGSQVGQGVGENNRGRPGHTEFSAGVVESSHEALGVLDVDVRTWERVSNNELSIHPNEDDVPGSRFRLVLTTGERGCDKIERIWVGPDGEEGTPSEHYRGAICTVVNAECPPEPPPPPHNCYNYHYTWCDEQGANGDPSPYGEDSYCNR